MSLYNVCEAGGHTNEWITRINQTGEEGKLAAMELATTLNWDQKFCFDTGAYKKYWRGSSFAFST